MPDNRRRDSRSERAVQRRNALRRILDDRGLTIKDAAINAGLPAPTALGNFLNGLANSLSMETAEPLAESLGISLNELNGDARWVVVKGRRVQLRGTIATGQWQPKYTWPEDRWENLIVPIGLETFEDSYFLRLDTTEMNEVYPPQTILEVVDFAKFDRPLGFGKKVIIERRQSRKVEIGCREIVVAGDDAIQCHLVARSAEPQFRGLITAMPWPLVPGRAERQANGDSVTVRAIVVRSIRSEIA